MNALEVLVYPPLDSVEENENITRIIKQNSSFSATFAHAERLLELESILL